MVGDLIMLQPKNNNLVGLGKTIYIENCASCHGHKLEGQKMWQTEMENGLRPAPTHDKTGHTWHHPNNVLFKITKFGIEEMLGRKYPNNMPIFKGILSDDEIISALSYIKSRWPNKIQRQHNQINQRFLDQK